MGEPPDSAYAAGLKMLARRELSEAQLRQRLARRGHGTAAIEEAVAALREAGSVDDTRAAGAIARTEAGLKRRGRLRVRQRLAAAGIPSTVADRAVEEVFETLDADALLAAALDRRLGAERSITDDREFARLYRHLVGQGFERDRVLALLRARQSRR